MAKIKMATGINPPRGKQEGFSFQTGHYYPTVARKSATDRSRYQPQSNMLLLANFAASQWRSAPQSLKDDYNYYAATYSEASERKPDILLSGFNMFVRRQVYFYLQNGVDAGFLEIDTSANYGTPPGYIDIFAYPDEISLSTHGFFLPYKWQLFLNVSQPVSPGKYYAHWLNRYILNHILQNFNQDLTAAYLSIWGRLPLPGQVVFFDCTLAALDSPQVLHNIVFPSYSTPSRVVSYP